MWSYFFTSVSKKMGTFFSDEQTRWAPFFQMSKPDEHYSLDEHVEMRTFSQMSKLRWALFICRWALFTYEMSTCRQCGCEDQLIFIFWLFLTIFNLPLFIWILLKLFNIVCPSNFFYRYFAIGHLSYPIQSWYTLLIHLTWSTRGTSTKQMVFF